MFARHVTLGRVVIVVAGLLVLVSLASRFWGDQQSAAHWAVFGGAALVLAAILSVGRAVGRWAAGRRGANRKQGGKYGMVAAALLFWLTLNLYRLALGG